MQPRKRKMRVVILLVVLAWSMLGCDNSVNNAGSSKLDLDFATDESLNAALLFDKNFCRKTQDFPVPSSVWRYDHKADSMLYGDIAFDNLGRMVSVDATGNLVRYDANGVKEIWIENAVNAARSMAFLSTGELVVIDSGAGSLLKFRPDGMRLVLASYLDLPSGLAVDKEDYIYVAEQVRRAILRVHPLTGASDYIAKQLPVAPGDLEFSPDNGILYVAGSGNGAIYALHKAASGRFDAARLFAVIPSFMTDKSDMPVKIPDAPDVLKDNPPLAPSLPMVDCAVGVEGDNCLTAWGAVGECRDYGKSKLFCAAIGPCYKSHEGAECKYSNSLVGICREKSGYLECVEPWSCEYVSVGAACTTESNESGSCQVADDDKLECVETTPCGNKLVGSSCIDSYAYTGVCEATENGELSCVRPPPCQGKTINGLCADPFTNLPGRCQPGAGDQLVCQLSPPCMHLSAGEICKLTADKAGTCVTYQPGSERLCQEGDGNPKLSQLVADGCGSIYVAAQDTGVIWRVSNNGENIELISSIQRYSVSGMQLGPGISRNEADTLYLSIDGGREIDTVPIGIPAYPKGTAREIDTSNDRQLTESFDCQSIPNAPIAMTELDAPRGYHDLAIDASGYMIGYDGSALVRVSADNRMELFAVGLDDVQGFDWLPDGSLAVSAKQGLLVIHPNGAKTVLATDIQAYGVTVGPDGMIYAADNDRVFRVHPASGKKEVLLHPSAFKPREVNFDPDYTLMYMTTLGNSEIHVVPLDDEMNPAGDPTLFAKLPGTGNHDGLGVDICGNLYVPDFNTLSLYRVRPDGVVNRYLQWDALQYGHGIRWGTGKGGFDEMALYLPQPNDKNTVVEVKIGVPSAH